MPERFAMMREWFRTVWTRPLGELTLVDLSLLAGLAYLLLGSVRLVEWMLDDWQRAREWKRATKDKLEE
jgi:hypothetical protein